MNNSILTSASEDTSLITGKFLPADWLTETPPEHEFCVNPLLPVGAVTLLNAHGGTGKSLFALKMAVHIALGIPIIGAETNGGKVAYMHLEDSENIVRNRIYKIVNSLSEEDTQRIDELTDKILIIDRYGLQTHMAVNDGGNIETAQIAYDLSNLLKKHEISCVFVDTFIRTNTLNENDNAQMGALISAFEHVAQEAKCAILLIHHLPKSANNQSYAARGASAITDNARSALLLEIVPEKEADNFTEENIKASVSEGRLIKVIHTKHNYSVAHPVQYLVMSNDGVLLEVFPTSDSKSSLSQRYSELYSWWEKIWEKKSLTKTNIEENVKDIRPANTSHGKNQYTKALEKAFNEGWAKIGPSPERGSNNPNATYYTLFPEVSD